MRTPEDRTCQSCPGIEACQYRSAQSSCSRCADGTYSTSRHEMSCAEHRSNIGTGVYEALNANWTWPGDCSSTPACPSDHCCFVVMINARCAMTMESTCDDHDGSWDEGQYTVKRIATAMVDVATTRTAMTAKCPLRPSAVARDSSGSGGRIAILVTVVSLTRVITRSATRRLRRLAIRSADSGMRVSNARTSIARVMGVVVYSTKLERCEVRNRGVVEVRGRERPGVLVAA